MERGIISRKGGGGGVPTCRWLSVCSSDSSLRNFSDRLCSFWNERRASSICEGKILWAMEKWQELRKRFAAQHASNASDCELSTHVL